MRLRKNKLQQKGGSLPVLQENIIRQRQKNVKRWQKVHWNSIKADGDIADDLLKDLLDKSYALVLSGFRKKKQAELLQG